MITPTPQVRVLVAVAPVDFRAGIDGLAQRVRQVFAAGPMIDAVFRLPQPPARAAGGPAPCPQDPGNPAGAAGQRAWCPPPTLPPSATPAVTRRFALLSGANSTRVRPVLNPVRGAHTVPDLPMEFTRLTGRTRFIGEGTG